MRCEEPFSEIFAVAVLLPKKIAFQSELLLFFGELSQCEDFPPSF